MHPELHQDDALDHQRLLEVANGLVGALPLGAGGIPLDPLDEHPAVPAAIEHCHTAQAGHLAGEAPQEVVPLLSRCGGRVVHDRVVTGVEVPDDGLDRPTLARCIGPLEQYEQARPDTTVAELSAQLEAQLQQSTLAVDEASFVLDTVEPLRQIESVDSSHPVPPSVGRQRCRTTRP